MERSHQNRHGHSMGASWEAMHGSLGLMRSSWSPHGVVHTSRSAHGVPMGAHENPTSPPWGFDRLSLVGVNPPRSAVYLVVVDERSSCKNVKRVYELSVCWFPWYDRSLNFRGLGCGLLLWKRHTVVSSWEILDPEGRKGRRVLGTFKIDATSISLHCLVQGHATNWCGISNWYKRGDTQLHVLLALTNQRIACHKCFESLGARRNE